MKSSFKRIDFSLRPAKHAERRMLNDVFRRMRPFGPLEEYRYIGLGSLWFSDFVLFHRTLGIRDMLSIERDKSQESRFKANKPFAAITLDFRETSTVLPSLEWKKPSFIWLDYDDPIAPSMLFDLKVIASRIVSGSVLAVTVQCQGATELDESDEDPTGPRAMIRFKEHFGAAIGASGSIRGRSIWLAVCRIVVPDVRCTD